MTSQLEFDINDSRAEKEDISLKLVGHFTSLATMTSRIKQTRIPRF